MSSIASLPGDALELARAADPLERMQHAVGVVLDLGHRDALGARKARESGCSRSGRSCCQPAVLDRRDHAAQRLADAAEGDALLDRHRGRSLPPGGVPQSENGTLGHCRTAGLQGYTRRYPGRERPGRACGSPHRTTEPARTARRHLGRSIHIDLPRAKAPPARPQDEQDPACAAGARHRAAASRSLALAGYVLSVAASAPPLQSLKPIDQGTSSAVYAADGSRLGFIQSDEIRTPIPLDRIPDSMRAATIAIEDERFYQHGGVDYEGIVRAAFKNLEAGKAVEGGSTITQQLVRNLYVGPRARRSSARSARRGWPRSSSSKHSKHWILQQLPELGALRDGRRPDRRRRAGGGADLLRQAGQEPDARGVGAARRPAAGAERAEPVPEPEGRARAPQRGAARRWRSSATSRSSAPPRPQRTPLRRAPRRPLHEDPRAVLLRLRQAAADRPLRRQHRAQGRAEGLHDDRPEAPEGGPRRDRLHALLPERPELGGRRDRPAHRLHPRDGVELATTSTTSSTSPRRATASRARRSRRSCSRPRSSAASTRTRPATSRGRSTSTPRTTAPGRSRPTTRPTAAR